jgi:hypothetical protein
LRRRHFETPRRQVAKKELQKNLASLRLGGSIAPQSGAEVFVYIRVHSWFLNFAGTDCITG